MQANVSISEMLAKSDNPYLEFVRVPSLSVGIYVLATDNQTPHHEDEGYCVASGRAKIRTETDGLVSIIDLDPGTSYSFPRR